MIYFSKQTTGFYDDAVNKTIPADAVQITEAQRKALIDGQALGKQIKADASGNPLLQDPPAPVATVPYTVTPFQAKAALLQAGLLDTVKAAIASAPAITQLAWSDATEFTRDSPTIATMAGALGLSSAQVDALFVAAAAIQA